MVHDLTEFEKQNYENLMKDYNLFFKNSAISHFAYSQLYLQQNKNNIALETDYFFISTDSKWTEKRLSKDWTARKAVQPISQAIQSNKIYPYMWPSNHKGDDIMEAFFEHGYREALTIYKTEKSKLHVFNFSIKKDKHIDNIHNFYFHELQNIWHFCLIFLSHFENYFKDIKLPTVKNKLIKNMIIKPFRTLNLKVDQYEDKLLKKIKIFKDHNLVEITKRQFFFIEQISYGFSFKQIANNMNISVRTVEANYNILKKTLGLYSKDKILNVWRENNFS